jgi:hypothetical protein
MCSAQFKRGIPIENTGIPANRMNAIERAPASNCVAGLFFFEAAQPLHIKLRLKVQRI